MKRLHTYIVLLAGQDTLHKQSIIKFWTCKTHNKGHSCLGNKYNMLWAQLEVSNPGGSSIFGYTDLYLYQQQGMSTNCIDFLEA